MRQLLEVVGNLARCVLLVVGVLVVGRCGFHVKLGGVVRS
jgi:hypothetical protein